MLLRLAPWGTLFSLPLQSVLSLLLVAAHNDNGEDWNLDSRFEMQQQQQQQQHRRLQDEVISCIASDSANPIPLDNVTGTFTVPDWRVADDIGRIAYNLTADGLSGEVTVLQDPAPGTVIADVVAFVATFTVAVDGTPTSDTCSIDLQTVDVFPPSIDVTGVQDGDKFVVPTGPSITVTAEDAVDDAPTIALLLDEEPYTPGMAISEGAHWFQAFASDASGNERYVSIVFEMVSSPTYTMDIQVDEFTCQEDSGEAELFAVFSLLPSANYDAQSVDIDSMLLWVLGADRLPLNLKILVIQNSALLDDDTWRVWFVVNLGDAVITGCPGSLLLSGDGDGFFLEGTVEDPQTLAPAPVQRFLQTSNPQCPLIPDCCEEDCCGPDTSWDDSLCVADPGQLGWQGVASYSPEHEFGCVLRVCCEEDCCGRGTIYDPSISCCVMDSTPTTPTSMAPASTMPTVLTSTPKPSPTKPTSMAPASTIPTVPTSSPTPSLTTPTSTAPASTMPTVPTSSPTPSPTKERTPSLTPYPTKEPTRPPVRPPNRLCRVKGRYFQGPDYFTASGEASGSATSSGLLPFNLGTYRSGLDWDANYNLDYRLRAGAASRENVLNLGLNTLAYFRTETKLSDYFVWGLNCEREPTLTTEITGGLRADARIFVDSLSTSTFDAEAFASASISASGDVGPIQLDVSARWLGTTGGVSQTNTVAQVSLAKKVLLDGSLLKIRFGGEYEMMTRRGFDPTDGEDIRAFVELQYDKFPKIKIAYGGETRESPMSVNFLFDF